MPVGGVMKTRWDMSRYRPWLCENPRGGLCAILIQTCAAACSTPTAEKTRTSAASVTKIGGSILLPIIFMLRPYGHATNFCIAHITVELREVWPFLRLLRLNCADPCHQDRRRHVPAVDETVVREAAVEGGQKMWDRAG